MRCSAKPQDARVVHAVVLGREYGAKITSRGKEVRSTQLRASAEEANTIDIVGTGS